MLDGNGFCQGLFLNVTSFLGNDSNFLCVCVHLSLVDSLKLTLAPPKKKEKKVEPIDSCNLLVRAMKKAIIVLE